MINGSNNNKILKEDGRLGQTSTQWINFSWAILE